jgi:hypothetical protein
MHTQPEMVHKSLNINSEKKKLNWILFTAVDTDFVVFRVLSTLIAEVAARSFEM